MNPTGNLKVLVVGSGGREHALAWKISQSERIREVCVAPGNAGTVLEPKTRNVDIGAEDIDGLLRFALDETIDITVVGPEVPLTLGIVNRFEENGLRCFGPSQEAARVEGSKEFTKRFCIRHNIPTAQFKCFDDIAPAHRYIDEHGAPIVVKADGLAAGKGVVVSQTIEQAKRAVDGMLGAGKFGAAGDRIVVEQFLEGQEASYICIVDGDDILPMVTSQDHKAAFDGDTGPNTGGMGAYSPAPVINRDLDEKIMQTIIRPTVTGLLREGVRYRGFLYAGLMIDANSDLFVLEYNCRFGDPETQPVLMRLKSDLVDLIEDAFDGRLGSNSAIWDERPCVGVVAAAGGYPGDYVKGATITGLDSIEEVNAKVFHAGTARDDNGQLRVNGGRVLCVTALGDDFPDAQARAYRSLSKISFNGMHYRTDIGHRALSSVLNA